MRVPRQVVGRTSPSSQGLSPYRVSASPDAFGAGIGRAAQGLGEAMMRRDEQNRLKAEQEAKSLQDFQARKLLATSALSTERDFNERIQSAPLGAEGFTDQLMADYEAKHNEILGSMREQGYDPEIIQDTELRLLGIRDSLQTKGLTFQNDSRVAKVQTDLGDMGLDLSQLASMNPSEMAGALELLDETIDQLPGIDAITKERLKEEQAGVIRKAAGLGMAQRQPEVVVSLLGGDTGDYYSKIRSAESGGDDRAANPNSTARGRYQFLSGTWAELVRNNPNSGLTLDGRFDSQQQEIAIRIFTEQNGRQLEAAGIPATHANLYAAHFLGAGGAKLVLQSSPDTPISAVVPPAVIQANPFLSGMTVADFNAWTLRKTGGGQMAKATDGKTGNPVLDALTVAERQQVLSAAQTAMNQQQAAYRADLELRRENAEAAFMQGIQPDGPIPSAAEFYRAYDPMVAEQKLAEFEGARRVGTAIGDMRTMSTAEIQAAVAAAQPIDTTSPTYAVDTQTYVDMQTAAKNVMEQRAADPAGYVLRNFPKTAEAWTAAQSGDATMQGAFREMQTAYDTLGVPQWERKAFPEAALAAQINALDSMTPEAKIDYISSLKNQAGDLFGPALSQLASNGHRTEAYLAGMVAQDYATRAVAANVLRGQQILAEDPTRKPSEQQTKQNFRTELGDAQMFLDPAASGAMFDAAVALYVQKGGAPDMIDTELFRESLHEAAGGAIVENSSSRWFGGSLPSTILPPGIDEIEFTDFRETLTDGDLIELSADGSVPLYTTGEPATASDIFDEGAFVRVGPSAYSVLMRTDGQPLLNASGQRYIIQLDSRTIQDRL